MTPKERSAVMRQKIEKAFMSPKTFMILDALALGASLTRTKVVEVLIDNI
jgi:hydroxyethylthiazole kinase-like sugar kinase family protein